MTRERSFSTHGIAQGYIAILVFLVFILQTPVTYSAGVTIITHGHSFATNPVFPWLTSMRDAIAQEITGSSDTIYADMTVDSGMNIEVAIDDAGSSTQYEIIMILDWSDALLSDTTAVADAVANELIDLGYAELPLHLAGHSRGASLVSEIARELGERGIWTDHLTVLDPHPVSVLGDAEVVVREKVVFADNFWRADGCDPPLFSKDFDCEEDPDGEWIDGTYDRELTEFIGDDTPVEGYDIEHSDTHLWYHGTIDLNTPVYDGEASINEMMRDAWWTASETRGATTGYYFTRLVGGARPADGVNVLLGGDGARSDLETYAAVWPNVVDFAVEMDGEPLASGANTVARGSSLDIVYTGEDGDSAWTVTVFLDDDRNPYNGVGETVYLGQHGAGTVQTAGSWDAAGPDGDMLWYLCAAADDGVRTRYMYAYEAVLLEGPEDDTYEQNDITENAFYLANYEGMWLSDISGLAVQLDDDWFAVTLPSDNRRVIIDCQFTHGDGDLDLELYDSAGSRVASSETESDDEAIDVVLPDSATYFVKVFGADTGNAYNLWWQSFPAAPLPPSNVDATDGTFPDRTVITWDGAGTETEYQLRRNVTDDPETAETVSLWTSNTWFADTQIEPDVTYYYWVQAKNVSGTSELSLPDTGWRAGGEPPVFNSDVNGTGRTDAVDIQLVINAVLGLDVPYATDIDASSSMTAVDVQLVINAALGIDISP